MKDLSELPDKEVHLVLKDPEKGVYIRTVKNITYNKEKNEYVILNEKNETEHIPRENLYRYAYINKKR